MNNKGQRFTTDKHLLASASRVLLKPARDRAVLYSEPIGERAAEDFVKRNPGYTRLDELLKRSPEGDHLFSMLVARSKVNWSDVEEIWWDLSRRLAHAASGDVHCFGPPRMTDPNSPVETYRHDKKSNAFANGVFEKVELPVLEANPLVTRIFVNGKLLY
jgi:hypothetical protein